MPATTTVSATGNQDVDGILYNRKWAVSSFTFSFPTSASFYQAGSAPNGETSSNFSVLNATQQDFVRNYVMAQFAAVANVTFSEITETSSVHADLRFAQSDSPDTAWAYYPATQAYGGDSWYNNSSGSYDNPVVGNYAGHTFLHEVGHAFGLVHGHEASNPFGALPAAHDSVEYSIMTYRTYVNGPLDGYTYGSASAPQTLMMLDIAALQYMYGANFNTQSGNTTYTWSSTTGRMSINGVQQAATAGNKIFMTLWDGGGTDTYDFSNYTTNLSVNLQPGAWTTVSTVQRASLGSGNLAAGNIANALQYNGDARSLIENAIGGTGNDTIIGNSAANRLDGRQGTDTLTGGTGNDTFVFASGYGADTVTDFIAGASSGDKIDLSAFTNITSLSQALSYASQQGANTVFNFGGGNTLTLANVTLGNLIADDFAFAAPPPIPPSPYAYAKNGGDFDGGGRSDILWRNVDGAVSIWKVTGEQYLVSWISNAWQISGIGDFNGDNKSDVLWRNSAGTVKLWQMNGEFIAADTQVGSLANDWHVVGIGDFNNDGRDDILWRNDNGDITIWQMNGTTIQAVNPVGSVSTNTRLSGIGDFNGDGRDDILWRDNAGAVSYWQMDGTIQATVSLGALSNDWHAVGVGDFDGNGLSDIVWRNDDGALSIWETGGTNTGALWVPPDWNLVGIGDFNVDGKDDILWQHNSGGLTMWQMDGMPEPVNSLVGAASSDWHIVVSADFRGSGVTDVLWRNDDGAISIWEMSGVQTLVAWQSNAWQIAGVGNLKGDGKADILWRHTNGSVSVWEANGTQYSLGSNTSDWQIVGIGDFVGDGAGEILWRRTDGSLALWDANGVQTSFGSNSSAWHIVGIGNLDGDSKDDILWRNDNGALSMRVTNGSDVSLGPLSNDWHVAGIGDFNGDGANDILLRNDSGAISMREANGAGHPALWVPNTWDIVGIGDYNEDGTDDILWRHDNGSVVTTRFDSVATLVGNASSDWQMVSESYGSPTPVGSSPTVGTTNSSESEGTGYQQNDADELPQVHNFPELLQYLQI